VRLTSDTLRASTQALQAAEWQLTIVVSWCIFSVAGIISSALGEFFKSSAPQKPCIALL
jgi:hypothetical protein